MADPKSKAKTKRKTQAGPGPSGAGAGGRRRSTSDDESIVARPEIQAVKNKPLITLDGRIQISHVTDFPRESLCLKYTETFEKIGAGCTDGTLKIINAGAESISSSFTDSEVQGQAITCAKHRPVSKNYPISNCLTCTYANGCVKCWNYEFKQCIYTIRENRQTYGITYHPRLPKFVTYGDDLKIYLYDEETKTQERILMKSEKKDNHDGPSSRVFAACFNPRSNYDLLTGGWDDVVHFWDLRQPHSLRRLSGIHICGEGIDINQKGTEILTCGFQTENQIQLWDYGSGKLISTITPDIHNSKLYCGKFATKDFVVTGGVEPNIFRVVNLQTYVTVSSITGLPDGIVSLDLGPHTKPKKNEDDSEHYKSDYSQMPQISFVAGKKLYQLDF